MLLKRSLAQGLAVASPISQHPAGHSTLAGPFAGVDPRHRSGLAKTCWHGGSARGGHGWKGQNPAQCFLSAAWNRTELVVLDHLFGELRLGLPFHEVLSKRDLQGPPNLSKSFVDFAVSEREHRSSRPLPEENATCSTPVWATSGTITRPPSRQYRWTSTTRR